MTRLSCVLLIGVIVLGWTGGWAEVGFAQLGQPPSNAPGGLGQPGNPLPPVGNPNIPPSLILRTPNNNPYPALPWGDGQAGVSGCRRSPSSSPGCIFIVYGTAVRTWEIPEQSLMLDVMVPQPGSLPATWESVPVTVPGYVVLETTQGYGYPGRWAVVQVAVGGYQWQWVPPAFYAK